MKLFPSLFQHTMWSVVLSLSRFHVRLFPIRFRGSPGGRIRRRRGRARVSVKEKWKKKGLFSNVGLFACGRNFRIIARFLARIGRAITSLEK